MTLKFEGQGHCTIRKVMPTNGGVGVGFIFVSGLEIKIWANKVCTVIPTPVAMETEIIKVAQG